MVVCCLGQDNAVVQLLLLVVLVAVASAVLPAVDVVSSRSTIVAVVFIPRISWV